MIDIETEELISIATAAKLLPGRPNVATLWRWRSSGIRGIRLETLLCGGRRFTSREAIGRFLAALNDHQDPPLETPARREAAIRRAESAADRLGL